MQVELFLTWAGAARRNRWEVIGDAGSVIVEDDRGVLRRGSLEHPLEFAESLSAGSHHADWFAAVIDELVREIADPRARGANLREAELCLTLTALAAASSAGGGDWLAVPDAAAPAHRAVAAGAARARR